MARNLPEWVTGTHSRSVIGNFFGLGAEQSRDKNFRVEADHPKVFASEDNAPTPVEIVLCGLASCLTAGIAAVAQRRGIQLHSVKATVEGDMDIQGILGMDDDIRNGFGGIRVHFDIRADASTDDIKSLVAQSQKRSAVFDIITNPTNVSAQVRPSQSGRGRPEARGSARTTTVDHRGRPRADWR